MTTCARLTTPLTLFLAASVGIIFLDVPAPQTLIGVIGAEMGLAPSTYGLVATAPLLGYALGLFLLIPLADLRENRALIAGTLSTGVVLAGLTAVVHGIAPFLALLFLLGMASSAVQMIVPMAAAMTTPEHRGRVVGDIMSGVMLGIMLSRPVASFVTQASSWHVVFAASSVLMAATALVLRLALPPRRPAHAGPYGAMLASMAHLLRTEPVLRRRALYQSCLFGSFSLFWTTVPLLLADRYALSQNGIALFALAGVAGAIAAPIAGRAADRGWSDRLTPLAMVAAIAAFLLSLLARPGTPWGLPLLTLSAITLDFGTTANFVLGQRVIFALPAQFRARLNGLYLAAFFIGGALCSGFGAWAYALGGWPLSSGLGVSLGLASLLALALHRRADAQARKRAARKAAATNPPAKPDRPSRI